MEVTTAEEFEMMKRNEFGYMLTERLRIDWETTRLTRPGKHIVSMFFGGIDQPARWLFFGCKLPMGREYSCQAQNIETIWDFISRHLTYYADSFSPLDIFAFIQVIAGFAKRFGTDEMKESVAGITATYYDKLIRNYRFVGPKNMSLTVRTYFE